MDGKKNILIRTFGCRVNQYDSAKMLAGFEHAGFAHAEDGETPDVVVVNTCTVTGDSDRKARQTIRKLAREHPQAKLVVTGCYAQRNGEVLDAIEGVHRLVPIAEQHRLPSMLAHDFAGDSDPSVPIDEIDPDIPIEKFPGRTRAFLKVQEGCDLWCTYCSIPNSRGEPRSREPEAVLREARSLIENGHGELVLCGTRLGSYGPDLGLHITDLLGPLSEVEGLLRLRLSSFEPEDLDERLIDFIAQTPVACPHLHLPLQAGSDDVLERMGRLYRRAEYCRKVQMARERIPRFELTTDIITGFPGESDDDFDLSLEMVRRCRFAKVHAFPYSEREGTPAATFEGSIDPIQRRARRKCLDEVAKETALDIRQAYVGSTLEVLVESGSPEKGYAGFSDNYLRVEFTSSTPLTRGSIQTVLIKETSPHILTGHI